ncbi:hypothetical protein CAJAP_08767 [Camponotus japonicus]
MTQNFTIPGIK